MAVLWIYLQSFSFAKVHVMYKLIKLPTHKHILKLNKASKNNQPWQYTDRHTSKSHHKGSIYNFGAEP